MSGPSTPPPAPHAGAPDVGVVPSPSDAELRRILPLALDAAKLGWFAYDGRTGLTTQGGRYLEIFGVPGPVRVPREELAHLLHPDDRERVMAALDAALEPGDPRPYATEYRIVRPDGALRWVEARGIATFEGEGPARRVASFVGAIADITERKEAEQRIVDREAALRLAMEASLAIVFEWDVVRDRVRRVQSVEEALPGEGRGAATLEDVARVVHPDDRETFRANVRAALQAPDGRYRSEFRIVRPDGEVRWLAESGRVELDAARRPLRLVGISMDVTERRRAEEALRESEARLRQYAELVEHAPVLVRDAEDRIVVWNRGMERLYGWPRDAALGKNSHVLLQTRFPVPLAEIEAQLARDGSWEGELVHRSMGGAELVIASRWIVHAGAGGSRAAIVEVNADVTAQRAVERALREADRRKTEFLAVLSHELRNPLAPIRNAIFLVDRAEPGSERYARAKEVLRRQTEHLARLVDDLLDVTRISRGKIALKRGRIELGEAVARTVDDHRPLFERAGVALRQELAGEPAWIDADATRIAQLVGNLLQNALKFTPEGGAVTVRLAAAGGTAELRVADTGVGIPPARIDALFEPFAQEDQGLARARGGLGLGLYLVKSIAELHGGAVSGHSAGAGQGAEFVVTLPLAPAVVSP